MCYKRVFSHPQMQIAKYYLLYLTFQPVKSHKSVKSFFIIIPTPWVFSEDLVKYLSLL